MTIEQANDHLVQRGVDVGVHGVSNVGLPFYVAFPNHNWLATLDGEFTADDLEAIATLMRCQPRPPQDPDDDDA